ncbi:MAG: hypothetical protein M9949_13535 [Candidatus Kapabacteria bacterium]|nr:hypothetical protein [Candidatus Kapabacteria bacterium]
MNKIWIILILLVLNAQYIFSSELISSIEAQYLNDEVIIKVKIFNPTDDSYIFALSDWAVKANKDNVIPQVLGSFYSFSNEIYFIRDGDAYLSPACGVFEHKFDKIPHFVRLLHKDSLNLTIHMKNEDFFEPLFKDTTYRIEFFMFYSDDEIFYRSLRNINCKYNDIVSEEKQYSFNVQKTKRLHFHVGVPHFKGCKWDKKYSEILDIGFVNRIEAVCEFYVPGD